MLTFLNGPAAHVRGLCSRRAPRFLRVVHNQDTGAWDCLDQLEDQPERGETLYAYRRVKDEGWIHVCRRPRGSGTFRIATYEFLEPQPDELTLQSNPRWQAWALAQAMAEAEAEAEARKTNQKGA